jgi:GT2 family glycosyltransferase
MSDPVVIAVILNTSRRDDTLACIASIRAGTRAPDEIIVLDNRSTDGSADAIRALHPDVRLIELGRNLGYAGNNNMGIRAAMESGADWVLLLNEDTVLAPGCLEQLVSAGEADAVVGMVGPLIYHFDEPDVIQSAGGTLGSDWRSIHIGRNETDRGQFSSTRGVEWLSGCALLVRRTLVETAGMLDERFFYYWEENEWCVRARARGWTIVHGPAARLWHKGVRRDYRPDAWVTYYDTRNRLLFMAIHRAPLGAWIRTFAGIGRTLASWTLRPRWRHMRGHRDAMRQGIVDFFLKRWGMRGTDT